MPKFYSDYYFNGKRAVVAENATDAALVIAQAIARRRRRNEKVSNLKLVNVTPAALGGGATFTGFVGKDVDVRVGRWERSREWRGTEVRLHVYASPLL